MSSGLVLRVTRMFLLLSWDLAWLNCGSWLAGQADATLLLVFDDMKNIDVEMDACFRSSRGPIQFFVKSISLFLLVFAPLLT